MRRVLARLLVLAALLAPLALAGNADDYVDGFVDHTGYSTQRKVAVAPDGARLWTFVEPVGDATEVVVVRERDGRLEELPRPRAAGGNLTRPSLAVDDAGVVHLAWTERAEDDREVFAARLVDGRWTGATQLSGGLGYAGFPSLALDGAGRAHVAWYGFDGANYQTFYRAWDGESWSPATQLSSGTLDANNPSVVVDPEGGLHVAWYKDDGRRYRAWYAHRPPGEADFGLPQALSQGAGDALHVALAVDGAGRVHAAWDELHPEGYRVVHRLVPDGEERVLATGADAGEAPAIAAWNGTVLVAWATFDGRLLAAEPGEEPRPLLGGARGRHPSLRGALPFPAAERDASLDVLWTEVEARGPIVRHALVPAGCSPFEPPCAPAAAAVPGGGVALLLVAAALASTRRRAAS